MGRATIDDVARLAKVSIKTVSRVLNREKNVRPETRERVERAIKALHYEPNPSARGLAGRRAFVIGLLYDNPSASYVTSIQAGALSACRAAQYELLIHPCSYRDRQLAEDIRRLHRQSKADGFLITPPLSDVESFIADLEANGVPFVLISPGDRSRKSRSVFTNDRPVCAEMVRHLAGLGHRRIAFIKGHPDHKAVGERYLGYRDGLRSCELKLDRELVRQGLNTFESGVSCARELLATTSPPSAIFAANDEMAAGALRAALELGMRLPNELSVAGFDDIPLASQTYPSLTTISQPMGAMAEQASRLLLSQLRAEPENQELIELPSLIRLRESTAPPKARSRRHAGR
ncbi:MAG: LacI family DNA-binding transcriptional regulator [Gammaproteobacteria bacterium]|nr:MAG: LacI family DNA-binding transcriptional regulator [Gammaproteobacteria bacterium]